MLRAHLHGRAQALSLAENGPGSGWSRACAAARALVRYQLSSEGPLLRSTATSALPDQAQRKAVRRTLQRLTERMTSVVVDGMIDGSIRALDPHIAAQASIAAINAAAELHRWVASATPGTRPTCSCGRRCRACLPGSGRQRQRQEPDRCVGPRRDCNPFPLAKTAAP